MIFCLFIPFPKLIIFFVASEWWDTCLMGELIGQIADVSHCRPRSGMEWRQRCAKWECQCAREPQFSNVPMTPCTISKGTPECKLLDFFFKVFSIRSDLGSTTLPSRKSVIEACARISSLTILAGSYLVPIGFRILWDAHEKSNLTNWTCKDIPKAPKSKHQRV